MIRIDIDAVTSVIREIAAEQILPRFRNLQLVDIAFKIGDDPVTVADKEAESALSTRLSDLLPGSKVLGEEAFSSNRGLLDHVLGESPVWIIDPIDGTRNFVKGDTGFGVLVALAEQNQTIAGWIYHPTSDEVVTTEKGSGAWYKGEKLRVFKPASFENMIGYLGDRLIEAREKSRIANDIHPLFELMRASAIEYPRLLLDSPHFGEDEPRAHFRASMMMSNPWDDAAGILAHQEAGGYSSFWDGTPYAPSIMNKGVACAPDRDSWQAIKNWCRTFANLP